MAKKKQSTSPREKLNNCEKKIAIYLRKLSLKEKPNLPLLQERINQCKFKNWAFFFKETNRLFENEEVRLKVVDIFKFRLQFLKQDKIDKKLNREKVKAQIQEILSTKTPPEESSTGVEEAKKNWPKPGGKIFSERSNKPFLGFQETEEDPLHQ